MSRITIHRTAAVEPGEGRTLHGIVVPFGQTVDIDDQWGRYRERFERGAFLKTIEQRGEKIRLFSQHNRRSLPIGKATRLVETRRGLYAEFAIARTTDGDDALELVRTGVVDSFSVSFRPIRDRQDGDVVVRTEVALQEVSLVDTPAYSEALVGGIRSHNTPVPISVAAARLRLLDIESK